MISGALVGDKKCYMYFYMTLDKKEIDGNIIDISVMNHNGEYFYGRVVDLEHSEKDVPTNIISNDRWEVSGPENVIGIFLCCWINRYANNNIKIQFCGDKCHLEFSKLMDIIHKYNNDTKALSQISECVVDINQEIGYEIKHVNKPDNITIEEYNRNFIPAYIASSIDRVEFMSAMGINDPKLSIIEKRNSPSSVYNAMIIRIIHRGLWSID